MKILNRLKTAFTVGVREHQRLYSDLLEGQYALVNWGSMAVTAVMFQWYINRGVDPKKAFNRAVLAGMFFGNIVIAPEQVERARYLIWLHGGGMQRRREHVKDVLKKSREDAILVRNAKRDFQEMSTEGVWGVLPFLNKTGTAKTKTIEIDDVEFEVPASMTDEEIEKLRSLYSPAEEEVPYQELDEETLTPEQREKYQEWGSIPGPQPEDYPPVAPPTEGLGYPEPASGTVQREGWTQGQSGTVDPPKGNS